MPIMQRVTITFDNDLIADIDAFMSSHGYDNRSEAIRDLTRTGMGEVRVAADEGRDCVAALVYMFDYNRRDLARRLASAHHSHHDLTLATTHVHLDENSCLEVVLLRGAVGAVKHLAGHVTAERGVRHGRLVLVPVEAQPAVPGRSGKQRHAQVKARAD
jgi:CopG family nickel-responsive transcriptional regulator